MTLSQSGICALCEQNARDVQNQIIAENSRLYWDFGDWDGGLCNFNDIGGVGGATAVRSPEEMSSNATLNPTGGPRSKTEQMSAGEEAEERKQLDEVHENAVRTEAGHTWLTDELGEPKAPENVQAVALKNWFARLFQNPQSPGFTG